MKTPFPSRNFQNHTASGRFHRRVVLAMAALLLAAFFAPIVIAGVKNHEFAKVSVVAAMIPGVLIGCGRRQPMMAEDDGGGSGGGNVDEPITSLLASIEEIRTKANAMLAGLPPLEQYESAQELSYGLRCLQSCGKDLMAQAERMKTAITAARAKVNEWAKATAEANAESALLAAGKYILKSDHEVALSAALGNKEKEMRDAFTAEMTLKETVANRRAELMGKKELPESAINAISAEVLGADNYLESVASLTARFKKISEIGLDPAKACDFVAELMALPLGEEGEQRVQARCDDVKKLIGATASKASASASATASRQIPVGGDGGSGAPVRIF